MIGIFIAARLGSTRLAEKHLITANGKTFIEWLVERYNYEFKKEILEKKVKVFIATSVSVENKKFEQFFGGTDTRVFYGSDENIPLRYLECAAANNIKHIISIDGDDILCSTSAARLVIDKLGQSDMVYTAGLPLGMNVSGFSVEFLRDSLQKSQLIKNETGWGKIFDKDKIDTITIPGFEAGNKIRMTLDYPEDAAFFEKVISGVGNEILSIPDDKLIATILKNNWQTINESLNDQYWVNFNKQNQSEN